MEAHLEKYVHTTGRHSLFPDLGFKNCKKYVDPSSIPTSKLLEVQSGTASNLQPSQAKHETFA